LHFVEAKNRVTFGSPVQICNSFIISATHESIRTKTVSKIDQTMSRWEDKKRSLSV